MIGRIFLLAFIGCATLTVMLCLGFGPSEINPHPSFIKEEILDESLSSINRYLIPEINKILPNRVYGTGHQNMVGFEELDIILYCPTDNLEEIERDCMMAYHAAQKGLPACKRLYNQGNHGLTSPNFIEIEAFNPQHHILAGVHHGKFYTKETFTSTEWDKFQEINPSFKSAQELLKDIGHCKFIAYYTTKIEQKQPALGLHVWILVGRVPSLEEGLLIYKKKYAQMLKWTQVHYPNHFLMLKFTLKNETTHFGVTYYNVRNHVAMFDSIPTGYFNGTQDVSYYQPNYLDDLVPADLHRPYYKNNRWTLNRLLEAIPKPEKK